VANPQRPVDLAREHGLSAQAVRNYEAAGVLPPAERSAAGYRRFTDRHAAALRAYLALVAAHGYPAAGEVMRAVHRDDLSAALSEIDHSHALLLRDRETLDSVSAAVGLLTRPAADVPAGRVPISAVAHRLGLRPATLRKWERAGILVPVRDPVTHHRAYAPDDVRDAQLAHLLRRGGYRLDHIATVLAQVRAAGDAAALAASLADWRSRLDSRGLAMLTAAGRLAAYLAPP
jgi:DNA-binding transcriptional MerR regulator